MFLVRGVTKLFTTAMSQLVTWGQSQYSGSPVKRLTHRTDTVLKIQLQGNEERAATVFQTNTTLM